MPRTFIEPFQVMAILARARELEAAGHSIMHMEIGEPDFPTPAPVVEAAMRALAGGEVRYAQANGLPQLREAIASFYQERYGINVSPARVVVTPGASGALTLAFAALVEPGDRVLIPDPGYPCYRHVVRLMRGEVVPIPLEARDEYQISEDALVRYWDEKARALILASPSNPTGTIISPAKLDSLVRLVRSVKGVVISDEIYHGLTYGVEAQTALADDVFVVGSFSKYFGMTGWRVGWLVVPEEYLELTERLMQNLFLATSTVAQHAALGAFLPDTREILEARRDEFRLRRDSLLPALKELGFDVPFEPQGAFYIYAGCSRFAHESSEFCRILLERAGVAITPGGDFGQHEAKDHVRFAYTTSMDRLLEAVDRIRTIIAMPPACG